MPKLRLLLPLLLLLLLVGSAKAVTPPAGITEYLPVNVINTQASAFPANAQISITINALSLKPYVTNTLNNTEWFFANGTVIPSWMEGNTLNYQQQANTLYTSANVMFWLRIANSINLFPASMTSNTVLYLGMAGNVPNAANMLFSSTITGEAPQLNCANPAAPATCLPIGGASSYGTYDSGSSVFAYYTNFAGSTLPTNWVTGGGSSNNWAMGNDIKIGTGTTGTNIGAWYNTLITAPVIAESLVLSDSISGGAPSAAVAEFSTGYSSGEGLYNSYGAGYNNAFSTAFGLKEVTNSNNNQWPGNAITMPTVISIAWHATGDETVWSGYSINIHSTDSTAGSMPSSYYAGLYTDGGSYQHNTVYQWLRVRAYPPNGINPTSVPGMLTSAGSTSTTTSTTSTSTTIIATAVVSSGPTNAVVDVGQWQSFGITVTGGGSPFTYNWLASNSVSNSITGNYLHSSYASLTDNWLYQITSPDIANSPEHANAILTDANSVSFNAPYSTTFTISAIPVAGLLTESNTIVHSGGVSLLTSAGSSGSGALSINWFANGACTQPSVATGTTYLVTPSVSTTYTYNVVDSASTPYSVCSTSNTVQVYTCVFTTSNSLISFPAMDQNTNIATNNAVIFTNTGATTSNVFVYLTSYTGYIGWNGMTTSSQGFYEANTVFSASSGTAWASATQITGTFGSPQDTKVSVPASSGTNTVWFGLAIPQYQGAQAYNTVMTADSSC